MNAELYRRKIKALTDEKLTDLLRITNNRSNDRIFELAEAEANSRSLTITLIRSTTTGLTEKTGDRRRLRKWNWAAFLLSPFWTLANGLDKWMVLWFIPVVNIFVIFYLGFKGNEIAFEKSAITSVDDYMVFQKYWSLWGIRMFLLGLALSVIFF
jgi:hypothetical protein